MPFVKLDCGILRSTLWLDQDGRNVFITALLMAEPYEAVAPIPQIGVRSLALTGWEVPAGWYGFVRAAGSGIVRECGIDHEAGLFALERLGSPDPESRTKDYEGRRLVRIDGGYIVLNFIKYRERDYTTAERSKRWREKNKITLATRNHAVTQRDRHVTSRKQKQSTEAEPIPTLPWEGSLLDLLGRIAPTEDADSTELAVGAALQADGWDVSPQHEVSDRGDGIPGRIDLLAAREGARVAIEIDRLSPRQKSLVKLSRVDADLRVVMLRSALKSQRMEGRFWILGMAELNGGSPDDALKRKLTHRRKKQAEGMETLDVLGNREWIDAFNGIMDCKLGYTASNLGAVQRARDHGYSVEQAKQTFTAVYEQSTPSAVWCAKNNWDFEYLIRPPYKNRATGAVTLGVIDKVLNDLGSGRTNGGTT